MSIHLEGGSLFVHSKRPDKFWTVDGLPSKKLKELEGQWKADTQRAVEKTKSKCEKEAKVLVTKKMMVLYRFFRSLGNRSLGNLGTGFQIRVPKMNQLWQKL